MAKEKKPGVKKPAAPRKTSTTAKKSVSKKAKVEGPSNYTKNAIYKLPMTPSQDRAFGKLAMSPKTADTLFTIPKGTANLPQKEIDAMQARRIADRKRTLSRAESIIRRTK